jgi:hypothetical protein
VGAAHLLHPCELRVDLVGRAIQLDDQRGRDSRVYPAATATTTRLDRELVHHLHRRRDDPARDDRGDRVPASSVVDKSATTVCTAAGRTRSRMVIAVTIPSVPSDPTNAPRRP